MLHRNVADSRGATTTVAEPRRVLAGGRAGYTLPLALPGPSSPPGVRELIVRFAAMAMPVPRHKSRYVRQVAATPVPMARRRWSRSSRSIAPRGVEPIDWVLYTSLPVPDLEEAMRVISYYEKRWLVEEYFKALKSGLPGDRAAVEDEGALSGRPVVRPPPVGRGRPPAPAQGARARTEAGQAGRRGSYPRDT